MADYKGMYYRLFNAITDAGKILNAAQVETEEVFVSQKEPNTTLLHPDNADGNGDA